MIPNIIFLGILVFFLYKIEILYLLYKLLFNTFHCLLLFLRMGKDLQFRFSEQGHEQSDHDWIDYDEIVFSGKKLFFNGSWNDLKEEFRHAMDIYDWGSIEIFSIVINYITKNCPCRFLNIEIDYS